jgi:hypothetical protein
MNRINPIKILNGSFVCALCLILLLAPSAPGNEQESGASRRDFDVEGLQLPDALRKLGKDYQIVVGDVIRSGPPYDRLVTVHLHDATVGDALDALVKADPRFLWRRNASGGIRVFSKDSPPNLPDVKIKHFVVNDVDSREASKLLDKLPEVARWLKANGCTRQEIFVGGSGGVQQRPAEKKFSLSLNKRFFWQDLEALAKASGTYSWSMVQWEADQHCYVGIYIQ